MSWMDLLNGWGAALIGGFFGSAGGAWGAQRIAERSASRKELLAEIRSINAAVQLAFCMCNAALAYRKQFSKPLYEELQQARADFEYVRQVQLIGGDAIALVMNLKKFPLPFLPVETLREMVFSRISAVGRSLAGVGEIESALACLSDANRLRDALIDEAARSGGMNPLVYLGLRKEGGILDERYFTFVQALDTYACDISFYSLLVCRDIHKHGKNVRKKLVELHGGNETAVPKLSEFDFSGEDAVSLLPPEANYAGWLRGFSELPDPINDEGARAWWPPTRWLSKKNADKATSHGR